MGSPLTANPKQKSRMPFIGNGLKSFFNSSCYESAYQQLQAGLSKRRGLAILTGATGSGKTLLLTKLMQESAKDFRFIYCPASGLDFDQLLSFICHELQVVVTATQRPHKLKALKQHFKDTDQQPVMTVLVLDEAHTLKDDSLSHLFVFFLSIFKTHRNLQLIMSGLPELAIRLQQRCAQYPVLADAAYIQLTQLNDAEATSYIHCQLKAIHDSYISFFQPQAIERIVYYGQGSPGLMNALSNKVIVLAQRAGKTHITVEMIEEAAVELWLNNPNLSASSTASSDSKHLERLITDPLAERPQTLNPNPLPASAVSSVKPPQTAPVVVVRSGENGDRAVIKSAEKSAAKLHRKTTKHARPIAHGVIAVGALAALIGGVAVGVKLILPEGPNTASSRAVATVAPATTAASQQILLAAVTAPDNTVSAVLAPQPGLEAEPESKPKLKSVELEAKFEPEAKADEPEAKADEPEAKAETQIPAVMTQPSAAEAEIALVSETQLPALKLNQPEPEKNIALDVQTIELDLPEPVTEDMTRQIFPRALCQTTTQVGSCACHA